jgi:hypothetical protein
MGSKSRETVYGASVRAAAEQAADARKQADRLDVRRERDNIVAVENVSNSRNIHETP